MNTARKLFYYNGGFLRQKRVRRILSMAGYELTLGLPDRGDMVAVWGQSPNQYRGQWIAKKRKAGLLRVEDAFLRSVQPGRAGDPPLGLILDRSGCHFDASYPCDLENILRHDPLKDTDLLCRAEQAIMRIRDNHISKYNAFETTQSPPAPGYVLVIDQTFGDAALRASGAGKAEFKAMLAAARREHPDANIIIKSHAETILGHRRGYFSAADATDTIRLLATPISPWQLFDGAIAVYTISSQMGFEAILAGHTPHVFGQPFYAGWGLSKDRKPITGRTRILSRAQLFAAAMILYPIWYDPYRDRLCALEDVLDILEAQSRAWRDDHRGWVACGMRLWKRPHLQSIFGRSKRIIFQNNLAKAHHTSTRHQRNLMVWASGHQDLAFPTTRIEDGFLRSRGLGATLTPPLSLVADRLGIYYDPRAPSQLEQMIADTVTLRPDQKARAERLRQQVIGAGLTKYNAGQTAAEITGTRRILVPGQVEDDASILTAAGDIKTNLALLTAVRRANPDAIILYKPHPDVEAGLRLGAVPDRDAAASADRVLTNTDPGTLLTQIDEVWTMTSLLGFEALLRNKRVVTYGAPFYAGWGLTHDLGRPPTRRVARPDLLGLLYATLIAYPRYFDPVTRLPCPVEVVVDRLNESAPARHSPINRALSKLQGLCASRAAFWR
ncbi:MAG TPA: beta-3-deoxy-D-manno-oct-2-ulosonic acid transferase [Rhodobacteraceae bacterium]|jgi:capsular polysaccharide export protein|nr:beta-3-deoxy-D-manno-oct-2-ulosonic acid transferase [Paracoccaceae bacterium]|tara:strand:- start:3393 stop:5396 length:2004 start_codon:yes stop_codon:yes gene_type:complete